MHAKTGQDSFIKLKNALTAARRWEPRFEVSLRTIIKERKVCTHHRDIIGSDVTHFNDIVQVEIHKDSDLDTGCILMTDLFLDFTLGITVTDTDPQAVIKNSVTQGQYRDGFGLPTNYIFTSTEPTISDDLNTIS